MNKFVKAIPKESDGSHGCETACEIRWFMNQPGGFNFLRFVNWTTVLKSELYLTLNTILLQQDVFHILC